MKMKNAVTMLIAMSINAQLWAIDCDGENCFKVKCSSESAESCYMEADIENAKQALREIRQQSQQTEDQSMSLETKVLYSAIGGAAGGIGGAAYANRAAYALAQKENEILAQTIKKQAKLITHAVEKAISGEIQGLVNGIAQQNIQLAQAGKTLQTSEAVANRVTAHLENSEVRKRITLQLERTIANANGAKGAKELAELIYHKVMRDSGPIIARKWHESAYFLVKGWSGKVNLGSIVTTSIMERTLPWLASTSAKRLLQVRLLTPGLWGKCKNFLKTGGWKAGATVGSALGSTLLFTMLDASPVADGTITGMYTKAPQYLLDLKPEEAERLLADSASVRNSVMTWRLMIESSAREASETESN
jgi:hypothetical protein